MCITLWKRQCLHSHRTAHPLPLVDIEKKLQMVRSGTQKTDEKLPQKFKRNSREKLALKLTNEFVDKSKWKI